MAPHGPHAARREFGLEDIAPLGLGDTKVGRVARACCGGLWERRQARVWEAPSACTSCACTTCACLPSAQAAEPALTGFAARGQGRLLLNILARLRHVEALPRGRAIHYRLR